jgi:hypothetical protein
MTRDKLLFKVPTGSHRTKSQKCVTADNSLVNKSMSFYSLLRLLFLLLLEISNVFVENIQHLRATFVCAMKIDVSYSNKSIGCEHFRTWASREDDHNFRNVHLCARQFISRCRQVKTRRVFTWDENQVKRWK